MMTYKKTTEKKDTVKTDVQIVDRRVQNAAGLDIPKGFGLKEILELVDISEKPIYVLWNDGKPVASETGGTDCIAYLCLKNGEIVGWSI